MAWKYIRRGCQRLLLPYPLLGINRASKCCWVRHGHHLTPKRTTYLIGSPLGGIELYVDIGRVGHKEKIRSCVNIKVEGWGGDAGKSIICFVDRTKKRGWFLRAMRFHWRQLLTIGNDRRLSMQFQIPKMVKETWGLERARMPLFSWG